MTELDAFELDCIRDHCRALGARKHRIAEGYLELEADRWSWKRIGTVDQVLDRIPRGAPIIRLRQRR